jgi:MFS family permease
MMIPVSRLVLLRSVRREEMVSAMSWLLLPALLGPILGPPLGALIMGWFGWRWIFFINVPISLLGAALITIYIADVREPRPKPFDIPGFLLSGTGLACLFLGFESVGRGDPMVKAAPLFAVGLIAAAVYILYARGKPEAILDLTLLKIPTFRLSLIAGSLTRITQGAQPFLLALMLQIGFGLSPIRSGLTTIASAVGALSMKALAPRLLKRFGFRDSLVVGGVLAAAIYALCGLFRPAWPEIGLLLVLFCAGACMSFQFAGYNTIAFDGVDRSRSGPAMGFHTTFQQLMLSVGVCTAASTLSAAMAVRKHLKPDLADFSLTFFVVTAISLLATIWNLKFAPDAGDAISGRRR